MLASGMVEIVPLSQLYCSAQAYSPALRALRKVTVTSVDDPAGRDERAGVLTVKSEVSPVSHTDRFVTRLLPTFVNV